MKNKVLAVFLSVLMCLSYVNLFPVSAETTTLHETYTFEEALAKTEEELAAISEEAATLYQRILPAYKINCNMANSQLTEQTFIVEMNKQYKLEEETAYGTEYKMDTEGWYLDLKLTDLTEKLFLDFQSINNYTAFYIRVKLDAYSDYTPEDVLGTLYMWMYMNENVNSVGISMLGMSSVSGSSGDTDLSGVIDISDAAETLVIYAKQAAGVSVDEYTERQRENADVNEDGIINTDDAAAILTYYAQSAAGLEVSWDNIITNEQSFLL